MKPLQIGVCSWSLAIKDLARTLALVKEELKLSLAQVGFFGEAIPAAADHGTVAKVVRDSGLEISATCIGFAGEDYSTIQRIAATGGYVPDDVFAERLELTARTADLTAKLGVKLLATHVGFVPHDRSDPKHKVMVERVQKVADALGAARADARDGDGPGAGERADRVHGRRRAAERSGELRRGEHGAVRGG